MKQQHSFSLIRAAVLLAALATVTVGYADPRQWSEFGVPMRQGAGIGAYQVAQNSAGYSLAVWCDIRSGSDDIYAVLIDPQGAPLWDEEGVVVVIHPGEQVNPVAVAVNDGWIVFWIDHRAGSGISSDSSFGDIYAQKLDASGNLLWPDNDWTGVAVDTEQSWISLQDPLVVVADANGGAFVAWNETLTSGGWSNANVMVQHVSGDGAVTWSAALPAVDNMYIHTGTLAGTEDTEGNLLVGWIEYSTQYYIRLSKLSADGQRLWGDTGKSVSASGLSVSPPQMATDGASGCYLAWRGQYSNQNIRIQRVNATGDTLFAAGGLLVVTGTNSIRGLVIAPSLFNSTQDGCLLTWADYQNGDESVPEIRAQKLLANGSAAWLAGGVMLSGNSCVESDYNPRYPSAILSDGNGGLTVIWIEELYTDPLSGDIYAGHINAEGAPTWGSDCSPVYTSSARQTNTRILPGVSGPFVFWVNVASNETSLRYQQLDVSNGQLLLAPDGEMLHRGICASAQAPQTIMLQDGRYAVVWQDGRAWTTTELYYQIFDAAGAVEGPVNGRLLTPEHSPSSWMRQENVSLCADGSGGFFAVYHEYGNSSYTIRGAHVDAAGEVVSPADGIAISGAESLDAMKPQCAPDGTGGVYVAWLAYNEVYEMRLPVQRVTASGDVAWTTPTQLWSQPEDIYLGGIVTGDNGNCILAWHSGGWDQFDVTCASVVLDGTIEWTAPVSTAEGSQRNVAVASDGSGGVYCAWESGSSNSSYHIFAQHILAGGQAAWTTNGVVLSPTTLSEDPLITHDRQGNVYVSWLDYRNSMNYARLYVQKVNANGNIVWGKDRGRPAAIDAPVSSNNDSYMMTSDAGDGLYLAWTDMRAMRGHIYATHLDSSGVAVADEYWTSGGGRVSTSWDEQWCPVLCPDGLGGMIVTYTDNKGIVEVEEPPQIYVQRLLDAFMRAPGKPVNQPLAFALHQNYPNPFNPSTDIQFDLPRSSNIVLKVYNLLGQEVSTILNEARVAGSYKVTWNGANDAGVSLPSGVYIYRLSAGANTDVKKMFLVR